MELLLLSTIFITHGDVNCLLSVMQLRCKTLMFFKRGKLQQLSQTNALQLVTRLSCVVRVQINKFCWKSFLFDKAQLVPQLNSPPNAVAAV